MKKLVPVERYNLSKYTCMYSYLTKCFWTY